MEQLKYIAAYTRITVSEQIQLRYPGVFILFLYLFTDGFRRHLMTHSKLTA